MLQKKDTAIILRAIPYEERHRIVTALTETHGQVTAMAKNCISSRRFGGALDPFVASEWHFTEKPGAELWLLQEAVVKRSFEGLRADFERLSLASVFNELMIRVAPKHEPCEELFRLHANALAALEELPGTGVDLTLLNGYLAKVLQWSGSQPQLQACMGCGAPIERACARHRSQLRRRRRGLALRKLPREPHAPRTRKLGPEPFALRVTPAAVLDFYVSLQLPIRQIASAAQASRKEHQALFKFLEALFVYHVPGFDRQPLKGLRFLELESTVRLPSMSPR